MAVPANRIVLSPRRQFSASSEALTGPAWKRTKLQHDTKHSVGFPPPDANADADADTDTDTDGRIRGESTLLSLDGLPLVHILLFLVDKPDDVEAYSNAHPPFRSVNRANELWERLCRSRWKDKFRYQERYASAKKMSFVDVSSDFWYQQYYQAEANATRSSITTEELSSLTFSCRTWFDPLITPPSWKKRPKVWMSGLQLSISDQVKFVLSPLAKTSGKVTGHPAGVINWHWQSNGNIINLENPRPSKFRTLRVRRLPNWGWELASDVIVLRAVDKAQPKDIEALWHDYTSVLIDQPLPKEVKKRLDNRFPNAGQGNKWREIPNIPELLNCLPWQQWDDK